MEGCRNKVFSSQAMSHCHKLRYRAFGVSSLKPFFLFSLFLFVSQYQKGDFVTKHEQFIQTTNFFFNQSHIFICWRVFLGDSHIHLTSIISRAIQFQIFYIFLKGSYTVHMSLKMPLFWTFWTVNLPLISIFYIHLTCTYYVRPASILSICHFFTWLCFYVLNSPDMRLSWQYATNLPLFQTFSIHLTCAYHVSNLLNMSPLIFYFHLICT